MTNYIILDDVDGYKARAEENIISFEIFNNILERKKKKDQVRALSNYSLIHIGWYKAFSCHLRVKCTDDETELEKQREFFPCPFRQPSLSFLPQLQCKGGGRHVSYSPACRKLLFKSKSISSGRRRTKLICKLSAYSIYSLET